MKGKIKRFLAVFLAFAMIFTGMAFDGLSLAANAQEVDTVVKSEKVSQEEETTGEITEAEEAVGEITEETPEAQEAVGETTGVSTQETSRDVPEPATKESAGKSINAQTKDTLPTDGSTIVRLASTFYKYNRNSYNRYVVNHAGDKAFGLYFGTGTPSETLYTYYNTFNTSSTKTLTQSVVGANWSYYLRLNSWIPKWAGNVNHAATTTGMAAEDITDNNNNLKFNTITVGGGQKQIYGESLFNTVETDNQASTNKIIKRIYSNVGMPFRYYKTTGRYEFDSVIDEAHFPNYQAGSGKALDYSYVSTQNNAGFFPFKEKTNDTDDASHYMGVHFSVGFDMTNDGTIVNGGKTEDITYDFTGDDDVWIYVDGKLVLDLGGIHDKTGGSINFNTGVVTYSAPNYSVQTGNAVTLKKQLYNTTPNDAAGLLNKTKEEFTSQVAKHQLQIFYLERGAYQSNLKMSFNLPIRDTLNVTKKIEFSESTLQEEKDRVNNTNFTFVLTKNGIPQASTYYQIYKNGSPIGELKRTGGDGSFTIKGDETASFLGITSGSYTVTEREGSTTTKWTVDGGTPSNGTSVSTTFTDETEQTQTLSIVCTNDYALKVNPDVIVLDYGKTVDIDVMANDLVKDDAVLSNVNTDNLRYGNASIQTIGGKKVVQYTLKKYLEGIDSASYTLTGETSHISQSADITIMPATTVYYEDDFKNADGKDVISYSGDWKTEGAATGTEKQDHGTVSGDGHPYGNDTSYENDATLSNGSAHYIQSSEEGSSSASFTFKGTGYDIISRTDARSPVITVETKRKNSQGNWVSVKEDGQEISGEYPVLTDCVYQSGDLYQIPVYQNHDLGYGTYQVTITVYGSSKNNSSPTFYLDGVRIYEPLGTKNSNCGADYTTANNQYLIDNEANAEVTEIRDILIDNKDQSVVVYVDQHAQAGLTTFNEIGPNNEVYLKPNQGVAFRVLCSDMDKISSVQIGMKSPTGNAKAVVASNLGTRVEKELKTSSDMYYDITNLVTASTSTAGLDGSLYITNPGLNGSDSSSILSLTNIKITFKTSSGGKQATFDASYTQARIAQTAKILSFFSASAKSGKPNDDAEDKTEASTQQGGQTVGETPQPSPSVPKDETVAIPKISSVKNKKESQAKIKWAKVGNAAGYILYRSASKNAGYKKIGKIKKQSATTFVDKKVMVGEKYYYKIRAYKMINGEKIMSNFSKAKNVKIKK